MIKRRRGLAIVETSSGIVVVAGRNKIFSLPGGGAEHYESRETAAIRELYEEAGLKALSSKFIFSYSGRVYHNYRGKKIRNNTKVFEIRAVGIPKPGHEIKYVTYWTPNCNVRISNGTKKIIEKYYHIKMLGGQK